MTYQVICGNNIEVLKTLPPNSVDSIVTDPPYGIDFLGKAWDSDTGSIETYQQCYRVLKPGGHLLAFSAARTYHHLAMSVERSGFEIRDQIMWIYGSGFPKSQDIGRQLDKRAGNKKQSNILPQRKEGYLYGTGTTGHYAKCPGCGIDTRKCSCGYRDVKDDAAKQWSGWGTALKPAHEPIVLARKPVSEKNIADNCLKHGTGALNIAESRVGDEIVTTMYRVNSEGKSFGYDDKVTWADRGNFDNTGRYPSNVIGEIDEPYQKYFYCPKISRKERHTGFDLTTIPTDPGGMLENNTGGLYNAASKIGNPGNNHPTVKPVELMKYLIRLVTPEGGLVVDPFNGSGSTGMAAVELGYDYLGIDLDPNYVDISLKRIAAWEELHKPTAYSQLFTE